MQPRQGPGCTESGRMCPISAANRLGDDGSFASGRLHADHLRHTNAKAWDFDECQTVFPRRIDRAKTGVIVHTTLVDLDVKILLTGAGTDPTASHTASATPTHLDHGRYVASWIDDLSKPGLDVGHRPGVHSINRTKRRFPTWRTLWRSVAWGTSNVPIRSPSILTAPPSINRLASDAEATSPADRKREGR